METVTQIGLRGIGGSRTSDVEEARAARHRLITAADVHDHGQRWLCDQLPSGGDVFISIDCDGLDPSVAPGTGWPQPGGLTGVCDAVNGGIEGSGSECRGVHVGRINLE